jgi:hypothetical protein
MNKYRDIKPVKATKDRSKYKLATFVGFRIGDLGMYDQAQKMRDWADFVVRDRGLETAVKQELVSITAGKPVVLDTRKNIFGRVNKDRGLPLDPRLKLRSRNIILLAKEAKGKRYEYTRLQTNDNKLAVVWGQLPEHTLVTFPARIQRHDGAGYLLSSSSAQESKTVFKQVDEEINYFDEYIKALGIDVTPIDDLIPYHNSTEDSWERYVIVRGIVTYIGIGNENFRGTPCALIDKETGYDTEYQVKFYVPDHLRIKFGQYSEIILLGKTKPIKEVDPDNAKRKVTVAVSIDAWGIMTVPGKTTSPRKSLLEDDDDEIDFEGFIPTGGSK